jgi:hypothetical protein
LTDSPAANAGIATGRPLSKGYDFKLYKQWLSTCSLNHKCGGALGSSENLPTRFIKISEGGTVPEIRLVSSADISNRYAALSYCWGGNFKGVKTTAAVLQEHYNRIEFSHLPKTIMDAIEITKSLEIEYLWVDSLCITQDDTEDWASESKRMAGLYRSAAVTIVAASAGNANQGCLFPAKVAPHFVEVPITIAATGDLSVVTFANYRGSISNDFVESPWNKRAWCLQEYVLSPRLLYFFKDRVVWQCQEMLSADDYAELRRDKTDSTVVPRHFSLHHPKDLESWFVLVEEYSGRHLAKSDDKLIAVAALATHFSPYLESEYLSGIWCRDMHKGLLWLSIDSKMRTPPRVRAPSWSWAALDGRVSHLHRLMSSPVVLESTIHRWKSTEHEEASYNWSRPYLFLTARLRPVTRSFSLIRSHEFKEVASVSMQGALLLHRSLEPRFLYDAEDKVCGWVIFDQEGFTEQLFCLQAARSTHDSVFQSNHIIILKRSEASSNVFERVGAGEILESDFFDTVERTDVILI